MLNYDEGTIGKFTLGAVVRNLRNGNIGHVVGFSFNVTNELTIKINYVGIGEWATHPANLEIL